MKDNSLKSIFKYFLYLGTTGFGGPIALIQQMRKDLAESDKKVISELEFDQAFTMIKAMPGPIAFQMAVYCGQKQGKFWGGLLAGWGVVLPAFLMMLILAFYYDTIIQNIYLDRAIHGAQYAVASIILIGLHKLSYAYRLKPLFWIFSILTATCFYYKWIPETFLILGTGVFFVLILSFKKYQNKLMSLSFFAITALDLERLTPIFMDCFKTGALVFGTGLAAFPFLQTAFVDEKNWLSLKTFNDAVSFGQMTPGPVTIATTFMGYKMAHIYGAVVATMGLFLPAFLHISTWFPKALNWLSTQRWVSQFIFGSTAAVVGCVFVTVYNMNKNEFRNYSFWLIFIISLVLQLKWKKISIIAVIFIGALSEVFLTFLNSL